MKRADPRRVALALLVAPLLVIGISCSDDSTTPKEEPPDNLPPIPVPTTVDQLMPAQSPSIVVGMSAELDWFVPYVTSLQRMLDDGSLSWSVQNRYLPLACPHFLPLHTAQDGAADAGYIGARPRLLHTRHWRRVEQNKLFPGTSYTLQTAVSWGASTYHEENRSFSRTVGVEVSVGGSWGPLSASVSASYSETSTYGEVNSVTFTEETSEERSYTVEAPASGARVYVLWQLVDEFSLVDADGEPIEESPTLLHAQVAPVPHILFPNQSVVTLHTTDFD